MNTAIIKHVNDLLRLAKQAHHNAHANWGSAGIGDVADYQTAKSVQKSQREIVRYFLKKYYSLVSENKPQFYAPAWNEIRGICNKALYDAANSGTLPSSYIPTLQFAIMQVGVGAVAPTIDELKNEKEWDPKQRQLYNEFTKVLRTCMKPTE